MSMSERLEAVNGTLDIESSPQTGTRVIFTVPLAAGVRMAAAG
jgi:signal transduction histidine kinase